MPNNITKRGKFLCLEGPDNVGKSTLAALLSEWLTKNGISNILTPHPGSTKIGKEIRALTKRHDMHYSTEALLMAADNAEFINKILIPNLEDGVWVIGDRNNFISSMVYQTMSGIQLEELSKIHTATATNPPKIDLLLLLMADDGTRKLRKSIKTDPEINHRDRFEECRYDKVASMYLDLSSIPAINNYTNHIDHIDASMGIGETLKAMTESVEKSLAINGILE